ncbi:MAG: GNAT family N-acetyltransferase [Actinomycetota bacterium]
MRPLPPGYEIRPPTFDDVDGVAEMLLADDLADTGVPDFDADFVRDQWSTPGLELVRDAWVLSDPQGAVVGHGNVAPDGEGKIKSWGVVAREHRGLGLGAALLDRIEARAAERLAGAPGGALFVAVTDTDTAAAVLVAGRGFRCVRTFRHLQLDLDGPTRQPGEPPPGIEIRGIDPEHDLGRIHAIFVEAFRDEWGYRPIAFEEWSGLEVETPDFDPSLWLLASDGDDAVGALSGVVWGDRGWVGELGVRRPWRGRGIASALLRRAFATFASRGLSRVMLNVDSENSTGAVRLYERVGMRTVRGWDVYEKPVTE